MSFFLWPCGPVGRRVFQRIKQTLWKINCNPKLLYPSDAASSGDWGLVISDIRIMHNDCIQKWFTSVYCSACGPILVSSSCQIIKKSSNLQNQIIPSRQSTAGWSWIFLWRYFYEQCWHVPCEKLYHLTVVQGRCNREKPACKYFHPPQHLKVRQANQCQLASDFLLYRTSY